MRRLILAAGLAVALSATGAVAKTKTVAKPVAARTSVVVPPKGVALLAPPQTPIPTIAAGRYVLDRTHASMTVRVNHMGFSNYTFRFERMDAELTYDPTELSKIKLTAAVDMTSISTANESFDKELLGEKWLNAANFPSASFASTSIERTGNDTVRILGNLTFLGVTKPLVILARLNQSGANFGGKPTLGFSGRGALNRSDFGLSNFVPKVSDAVDLQFEVEFNKK